MLHRDTATNGDVDYQDDPILLSVSPLREVIEGSSMRTDEVLKLAQGMREMMGESLIDRDGFASWGKEGEGSDDRKYWQAAWGDLKDYIRSQPGFSEADGWKEYFRNNPVHSVLRQMRAVERVDSNVLFLALMNMGFVTEEDECTSEQYQELMAGTHPLCNFSKPGRGGINHRRLLHNRFSNWMRIAGVIGQTPYDTLHRASMYRFSEKQSHNSFLYEVLGFRNGRNKTTPIIDRKKVLSLGAGSGMDEKKMVLAGARSVDMFEVSKCMVERIQHLKETINSKKRKKFNAPTIPQDMFEGLRAASERGEKWDTIYAHSSIHYYDDQRLRELLGLIKSCLREGGHLCLAVKEPDVLFDRPDNGIVLLDDENEFFLDDRDEARDAVVRQRIRLCHDGILRVFRSEQVWKHLLQESGFEKKKSVVETVENYEVTGDKQHFTFMIYQSVGSQD